MVDILCGRTRTRVYRVNILAGITNISRYKFQMI